MISKLKQIKSRAGLTMMELVVVMLIIAILAGTSLAIAMVFISSGQQRNRMDIARSIYVAAQSQLSEMHLHGELDDFALFANSVFVMENDDYIHYISLPAGYIWGSDACPSAEAVNNLLRPIILYSEVFEHAILIEFSIRTGNVLSVFYSDILPEGVGFVRSAFPERGNYGYFSAPNTGISPRDSLISSDGLGVSILDSHNLGDLRPLGSDSPNILFARIIIPAAFASQFVVVDIPSHAEQLNISFFPEQLRRTHNGFASIYSNNSNGLFFERVTSSGEYSFIWVLDYVSGNTSRLHHSIASYIDPLESISVRIRTDGAAYVSRATGVHFGRGTSANASRFHILSARHLFNMRYISGIDGGFYLLDDIVLYEGGISHFVPIPDFRGTFNGNDHQIIGLNINGGAGLFAQTSQGSSINNLSLIEPIVIGNSEYTGSLVGILRGHVDGVIVENPLISGDYVVDDLVAYVAESAIISNSYVFFDIFDDIWN